MKVKKFIKNYYPLIFLFLVVLVFNILIDIKKADFLWFLEKAKTTNMIDYLSFRYNNWTSRLIIEFVLVGILKFNYVLIFKTINTLVMFFIPVVLMKLFCKNKSVKKQILVITLFLSYNFKLMDTAGWYATLINYMWPLLCLLVGLIPIKNYLDNKKEKWYMYVIYSLNILFACNQEQCCALLFGIYLIFLIYTILNKRISKFSFISLLISLVSLLFILTCPGNSLRSIAETSLNYPEYSSFSFIQKVCLGFSTIMTEYITNYNVMLFILSLLLTIIIFKKYNNKLLRFFSVLPMSFILLFNYMNEFLISMNSKYGKIKNLFREINVKNYMFNKPKLLIVTFFSILFLILIVGLLIVILNKKEKQPVKKLLENNYILLIFLIGLASRLIIGFSSTIFASGFRTNIFFDFSIIVVIILLIDKYEKNINKEENSILYLTTFISLLNMISVFGGIWR